ncbi:photosystem I assembly protein Ycf3 [Anatilimnocola aggregata]|uniref:Photosystem I assembly protein Ycf3 n=1 Tax=Anatilimnocola aggregata TaxID=2528021 RepID=A0A517YGT5_9BACT|nr:CHAT domain-containing tetratricopeptide repeat protein [Anatilimnocola aggregata]QDU29437.1 photosystem I assembly protein Ycf3 [Anatilimnocola aggregata]
MFRRLLLITCLMTCCEGRPALAVDGYMVVVTAATAPIKSENKVLGTIPGSTRIWVFEEKGDWKRVKVPGQEQKGWIAAQLVQRVQLTADQKEDAKLATAHWERGLELNKQNKLAEAQHEFERCLALERRVRGSDHPDVAVTLGTLGNLTSNQGDYAAARKYYDEALDIARQMLGNEHSNVAMTLNNLGTLARNQGEYSAAQKYFSESLALKRTVLGNDHPVTATTLANLGYISHVQKQYSASRQHYHEALTIRRKVFGSDHLDTATTLIGLSEVVRDIGDYAAARRYLEEALSIARKVLGNEHLTTAHTLKVFGAVLYEQGEYVAARKSYDEALEIKLKLLGKDHGDIAEILNHLGVLLESQSDYTGARRFYNDALAIQRRILGNDHSDTALTLNNLGNLASLDSDYTAARKFYSEALAIKRKIHGYEHSSIAKTLGNLAWLAFFENDFSTTTNYLDESRRAIRIHEVQVLQGISEAEQLTYLRTNHDENWHESLSFGRSQLTRSRAVELSAAWLINGKGITEESLATAVYFETAQINVHLDELRTIRGNLTEIGDKPKSEARDRRKEQLEAEQQRLVRLIDQARAEGLSIETWVDIEGVRRSIPAKAMLVNIVRFKPFHFPGATPSPILYVAWLIPSAGEGEVKIVDLGNAATMDAAVGTFRKAMSKVEAGGGKESSEKEDHAAVEKTLTSLADLIWKPLAEHLADKEELILSPDAALWLVPWGALPVEDGKFLIEKYNLKYVISGRELVTKKADQPTEKSVVLADPDFDLGSSAAPSTAETKIARRSITRLDRAQRLPGTAKEAEAIAPSLKTYGKRDPVVYLNHEATESQFKQLVSPQVLVLGTHGFFFPQQEIETKDDDRLQLIEQEERRSVRTKDGQPLENPLLRCGVLLAGCNRPPAAGQEDGVLTGLEIVNADLRGTELVVLSACQTGLGDVRSGEGVAGLRQAFQLAGAKAVVATLWQIPDDESAQLMGDFFGYLAEGKSKAEALRFAQLNRIVEHRERTGAAPPFYWAAFTLTE